MKLKIEFPVQFSDDGTAIALAKVVEITIQDEEVEQFAKLVAKQVAHEILKLVEMGNVRN